MKARLKPVHRGRQPARVRADGWHSSARILPSPHADPRPADTRVELIVIHAISLPPGRFGTDAVERLFLGTLDPGVHPSLASLKGLRVSAHFFIRRQGELLQFVPVGQRAWHAGVSRYRGRSRCNDHSIGIELEGDARRPFSAAQYRRLADLIRVLCLHLPIRDVAGHAQIAPRRKWDPGPLFDWRRLCETTQASGLRWPLTPAGRVIARRI